MWHDFPDFLCEFSNYMLDFIPSEYTQIRNLVLSATPSSAAGRLISYQLSFGSLNGALFEYKGMFENAKFMANPFNEHLKSFLCTRSPQNFPEELHQFLSKIDNNSKKEYIINSIITSISKFVIDIRSMTDTELFERNPGIPIMQNILDTLDPKGVLKIEIVLEFELIIILQDNIIASTSWLTIYATQTSTLCSFRGPCCIYSSCPTMVLKSESSEFFSSESLDTNHILGVCASPSISFAATLSSSCPNVLSCNCLLLIRMYPFVMFIMFKC